MHTLERHPTSALSVCVVLVSTLLIASALIAADGEPIIAALETGTAVRGIIGPQEDDLGLDSIAFVADENDLDPNPSNDRDRVEIEIVPQALTPPVASFTYSPANPTIGQPIQFTDTSTGGPPTHWTWDFGDEIGTSTEQNPAYTYSEGGTYTVSLTVMNSAGSDTADLTLFTCCGGEMSFRSYIPAAAFASGAQGAFFQTDLDVNNAGRATASYAFEWLPRGVDNLAPLVSETFTVGAGMGARYRNIVSEAFGLDPDSVGALAMVADSPHLLALSRTYNFEAADGGTFGQALPAIRIEDMIPADERRRIIFLTENDDYRSNIGCQNATDESLRVLIELFDDAGASLETLHLDLPPRSNNQLNRIFADHAPLNGTADIWASKPGAVFTCFGSLLDNGTNDPTTIMPQ